jgi:rhodanese-related sulfurtransferase
MPERLRISPSDAKARVEAQQAIVVDVVSPQAWDALDEAVPGAIRISPEEFGQRFSELPRERAIIAYCT